jgi:hypothetical protein
MLKHPRHCALCPLAALQQLNHAAEKLVPVDPGHVFPTELDAD